MATLLLLGCSAAALAQDWPSPPSGPGYPSAYVPASASPVYGSADATLEQRLAEVEDALRKLDEKAKADKKKAAGAMSATVGGRVLLDTATFDQDAWDRLRTNELNGVEFRTARLSVEGKGFEVYKYKVEFDFAGRNSVKAKDVYLEISELPLLGNLRIGHFKEPYSLDALTSLRFITFMERSMAGLLLLGPDRQFGVMAHDCTASERATWAVGYFAERDDDGGRIAADHMGGALTMRGTWTPWYDEAGQGRSLLHLGASYSYRDVYGNREVLTFRPESNLASALGGTLDGVDNMNLYGAEAALVYGPFSVQSEYFQGAVDPVAGADADIRGMYVYLSYFLTGENRVYKRSSGTFDRVRPLRNFFRIACDEGRLHAGPGAWELKYRYSYVDAFDGGALDPAAGLGQQVGNHTFGVNWYLNPYARLMAEYIHSGIDLNAGNPAGTLHVFQMRAQFDF